MSQNFPRTGVSFLCRYQRAALIDFSSDESSAEARPPKQGIPEQGTQELQWMRKTHNFSLLIPVKNGRIVLSLDAAGERASPKMAPFFPGIDRIVLSRFVHR
jgi:hypothetical protein